MEELSVKHYRLDKKKSSQIQQRKAMEALKITLSFTLNWIHAPSINNGIITLNDSIIISMKIVYNYKLDESYHRRSSYDELWTTLHFNQSRKM